MLNQQKLIKRTIKQLLGQKGESLAEKILQDKGYLVLKRNFRTKYGEIDLICSKNDKLSFVEVKTRSSLKYGYPEEAVNSKKIQNLKKAAFLYMSKNKINNVVCEILVVSIIYSKSKVYYKIINI